MKKLIILILFPLLAFTQNENCDNIIYRNGEEVFGNVSEISSQFIKYKKCDNLNGPMYSLEKSKILMIKYKNGTKDVFNAIDNSDNANFDISTSNSLSKKTANPSIGFKLGLQRVAVGNSSSTFISTFGSRLGLLGGITTFIPLGEKTDIRTGLIYTSKGASYLDFTDVYLALNYVEIPIDFAFKMGSGNFAFSVGPYLAFLTKAKNYDLSGTELDLNTYFTSPTYNEIDYGLNFGGSILIAGKFNLDVRYGMGLSDVSTEYYDADNIRVNAALQFSFGLQF